MSNSKGKIKVCVVASVHPDFDSRIWKQITSLANSGYEVHLVSTWDQAKADCVPKGIYFHSFSRETSRYLRLYRHPLHIWRLIRYQEFDLYHFHEFELLPFMVLLKLFFRRLCIYDIHEIYHIQMRDRGPVPDCLKPFAAFLTYWIEWLLAVIIRNLVTVVPNQQRQFKEKCFNKVLIRNYATTKLLNNRVDNYDRRPDAVIFVGSMYVENGALLLLEIAREVHKSHPKIKFIIADRFSDPRGFRSFFISRIKYYGLEDMFTIVPNILPPQIMQHLNLATIAIIPFPNVPQATEGFPSKLFEYMAAGLPVVANNTESLRDIIEKNKIGFCADPDKPEEFARHIAYLADHRSEAKAMGENGLKIFQKEYSWEQEFEKLKEFYGTILTTYPK